MGRSTLRETMRFRGRPMSSGRLFAFQYGLTDLESPGQRA